MTTDIYPLIDQAQDENADAGHLREAITQLYPYERHFTTVSAAITTAVQRIHELTDLPHRKIRAQAKRDAANL